MSIDGSINLGDLNGGSAVTPFSLSGDLEPGGLVDGDCTLPLFALEGAFDDGRVLPAFTLEATGETGATIDGVESTMVLPAFTLAGGFADGVVLPAFTLDATATVGAVVTGAVALPAFEVDGSLEPPLALPIFALDAVLIPGNVGAGDVQTPAFTLAATTAHQVDVTLAEFTLAATALTGTVATGAVQLAGFTTDATAFQNNTADGDVTLAVWTLAADGSASTVIDADITLSAFTLQALASNGAVATADLTLPLYTVDGAMGFSVVGYATITLPAFVLAGSADAPAGPQATQGAAPGAVATVVALNTRLKGVTLYEGLSANSFARFAGVTLAATPSGIVALTGDTDLSGAAIAARVSGPTSDFSNQQLKRVLSGYVGYRASGELDLTLIADEHHEYVYRLAPRQAAATLHAARVKFGHGTSGRYWQWKLANRAGEDFALTQLALQVLTLRRGV